MTDFNQGMSYGEVLQRMHQLDDQNLYWFEEPITYDNLEGCAQIAAQIKTPVQIGENIYGPRDFYKAVKAGAADLYMPDLMRIGGVTGWMRAAAIAGAAGLPLSSHLYASVSSHLLRASETAEMIFEDCRIHENQILGNVGDGFIQAMKVLDGGRISIAALSLGIAKGAFEASVKYAQEREQFGKPIAQFQAIAFKLADMATRIEAAELLTLEAADRKNKGLNMTKEGAMAKYYASEVSVYCANEAVQIFGGYGYTKDFPVEKFYRDCKLCTIGEGTSEIQKLVISRNILKD